MIVGFSGFGFPKAHGAAFGLLAYQSTWLRVHYGPEFLASLLDEQPMGFYPPDALVHEAQRRGIPVLPPDVNASAVGAVVDVPASVVPAARRGPAATGSAAAGAPPAAGRRGHAAAASARRRGRGDVVARARPRSAGRSARSDDLVARAGAGRPALERLAWSGACDALATTEGGPPRAARRVALWRLGVAATARRAGEGTQLALAARRCRRRPRCPRSGVGRRWSPTTRRPA